MWPLVCDRLGVCSSRARRASHPPPSLAANNRVPRAAQVFDDAVSTSLFTSPAIQRFKRQTEEVFEGVSKSVERGLESIGLSGSWNPFRSWW